MYEIANNNSGLLEGRKPMADLEQAIRLAEKLSLENNQAYQVWSDKEMLYVISAD